MINANGYIYMTGDNFSGLVVKFATRLGGHSTQ